MSVPVPFRSENKLQALKDTLEMTSYTIHMCENEKIFPKKSRWNLCSRIIDNCLQSTIKIRQANKINAKTKEDAELRVKLQKQVLLHFEALWGLMTIAYETYSIPGEKVQHWSELLLKSENTVSAWKNSDIKRFRSNFPDGVF